jgi:carbamoyl-phosphate synthase / aspartate carbamoyltransferase
MAAVSQDFRLELSSLSVESSSFRQVCLRSLPSKRRSDLLGMVGYPESITDPSYEGQILVITFPLVGNYGVPPRETILDDLPAYFESSRIHIAGLVVATYTEEYSHYLSNCRLGDWLKEQGIPGICGVDTRALTKRIRVKGSMLGKLQQQNPGTDSSWEDVEWDDPNVKNLVAQGLPLKGRQLI